VLVGTGLQDVAVAVTEGSRSDYAKKRRDLDRKLDEAYDAWEYEQDKLDREFDKKWHELDKEGRRKREMERAKLRREFRAKSRELDHKLEEERSKWRMEVEKLDREYGRRTGR
jgi:hypothetical protein